MKKTLLLLAAAATLAGCTYKTPLTHQNVVGGVSADYVKTVAILTAQEMGWQACLLSPGTYELYRPYKQWDVYAELAFNGNAYTLKPVVSKTTLAKEDGSVHRNVNNLTARLNAGISRRAVQLRGQNVEMPDIEACRAN